MNKIVHIQLFDTYSILCTFENGHSKELDVLPVIENHLHISGVEKLRNLPVFKQAKIGDLGQILWEGILENGMEYDISPEFAYHYGKTMELSK